MLVAVEVEGGVGRRDDGGKVGWREREERSGYVGDVGNVCECIYMYVCMHAWGEREEKGKRAGGGLPSRGPSVVGWLISMSMGVRGRSEGKLSA